MVTFMWRSAKKCINSTIQKGKLKNSVTLKCVTTLDEKMKQPLNR